MKIDVYFTPLGLGAGDLGGRGIVVIDVLRATTTIVTALANGAKAVIPAATSEEAVRLAKAAKKGTRKVALNDAAGAALVLTEQFASWKEALQDSEAAQQLAEADLAEDVAFAAKADRFGVVPTYANRRIT